MRKSIVSTALSAALLGALAFSTSAAATDLAPQVLTLSANVSNACDLSVQDFSLDADGLSLGAQGSVWVDVQCNQDTAYTVAFDQGENFGLASARPTLRAMTDGAGHFLPYELFTDATNTVPVSDTNVAGVGNGDIQPIALGVSVYDFNLVPQGTYTDHVNVILSFN